MPITRTPFKLTLNAAPATWTNQPAAVTELLGNADRRVRVDLTDADRVRLSARIITIGSPGAVLFIQYSTDESSWNTLTTNQVGMASTGTKVTAWEDLPAGAKGDVFLRLVGQSNNSTGDPVIGSVVLEVR